MVIIGLIATNNWNVTNTPCSWEGITCAGNSIPKNVTKIERTAKNLVGNIPSELGNLIKLELLNLYTNQLTGTIPVGLGNLINLETLEFGRNQLIGGISIELGNLTNLKHFSLATNKLTGKIPVKLGDLTNLTILSLFGNQLTGIIPSELGNLINLNFLFLDNNQLCGEIPNSFNTNNLPNLFENVDYAVTQMSRDSSLSLKNNHLSTSHSDVMAFLNEINPSWKETQTASDSCVSVNKKTVVVTSNVNQCNTFGTLSCNANGKTISDLKISEVKKGGNLVKAVIDSTLTNNGLLSYITVAPEGIVTGGKITSYTKNEGQMNDFEFVGASITGANEKGEIVGTLGGTIHNNSKIDGSFENIHLAPETHIIGGILEKNYYR